MSTVIGIISLVAGLAGSASAANAQQQAANAQAEANEYNAKILEENAAQAKQKAMWEEDASRDEARKLIAKQRAMYAKSGVDISEGSPLLIMADTAAQAEKDALAIRWQGDIDYTSGMNQAGLLRYYAKQGRKTGQTQSATTLLQGIGNAGMSYGKGLGSKT